MGWCSPSTRTMMRSESTESTMPLRRARMTAPESRAVTPSIPVPTTGAWARSKGSHGDELLRADVDVVDLVAIHQHEVAGLARVHQFRNNTSFVIEFHVRLRDDVAVFFPRREIEGERLDLD